MFWDIAPYNIHDFYRTANCTLYSMSGGITLENELVFLIVLIHKTISEQSMDYFIAGKGDRVIASE